MQIPRKVLLLLVGERLGWGLIPVAVVEKLLQLFLQHLSGPPRHPKLLALEPAGVDHPIESGHGNWPGAVPTVYRWPYDYGKPGSEADFIPQNVPYSATPSQTCLMKKNRNSSILPRQLLL